MRQKIIGFWALVLMALPVGAVEHIKHFRSDITVQADGEILVTETITVQVEHNNIKRGIYRDFPTLYKTGLMTKSSVDFEVKEILRNGTPEVFHTNKMKNGIRVYIGNKSSYVPRGEQTYTINYRTNRQIAFLDEHDRFYWNVTGNGWRLSMNQVTAVVRLPDGVSMAMVNSGAWTGFAGQTGADFTSEINDNEITIRSTSELKPYQGLTFSLEIPKGFIQDNQNGLIDFFRDNLMWVLMVVALLSLVMFYILAWNQVGRDPEAGVIIPLFYPPKDLSPAAMRYILDEKTNHKNFTAALISLAVKGYITLKKYRTGYQITKVEQASQSRPVMSSGEKIIMRNLLRHRDSFFIDKEYDSRIETAMNKVSAKLKSEYKDKCFKDNRMLGYFGIGISVLTLMFLMIHMNVFNGEQFIGYGVLFVVGGYAVFTIHKSFSGSLDIGHLLFVIFFSFTLFNSMGRSLPIEVIMMGGFLLLINGLFIYLLKAPTPFGRAMMDDIEGFKLYLSTAEQHRLDVMHPPEMSSELFEKYLPFAIALGVENQWSDRFARHLSLSGTEPSSYDYSPGWYSDSHFSISSMSSGFSDLSSDMSTTISSASVAPSSSDGGFSSGGGFSGGGGGGGGGGGW